VAKKQLNRAMKVVIAALRKPPEQLVYVRLNRSVIRGKEYKMPVVFT
jgi:hypothetical protein